MKKSLNNVPEKIIKLFLKDYQPKKIADSFNEKHIECKGNGQITDKEYVKNIGQYLHDAINDL